jgi:hypothetical protein
MEVVILEETFQAFQYSFSSADWVNLHKIGRALQESTLILEYTILLKLLSNVELRGNWALSL